MDEQHYSAPPSWNELDLADPGSPSIAEALDLKEARGALIAHAKPDAPGAQAGLAAGDVIASINGEPVKDNFDALGKVAALAPGTAVDLGIVRNGTETTVAAHGAGGLCGHPRSDAQQGPGGALALILIASPGRDCGPCERRACGPEGCRAR
jgi:serine protease Do